MLLQVVRLRECPATDLTLEHLFRHLVPRQVSPEFLRRAEDLVTFFAHVPSLRDVVPGVRRQANRTRTVGIELLSHQRRQLAVVHIVVVQALGLRRNVVRRQKRLVLDERRVASYCARSIVRPYFAVPARIHVHQGGDSGSSRVQRQRRSPYCSPPTTLLVGPFTPPSPRRTSCWL